MPQINAYINFKNNCREAMAFYHQCLGGKLTLLVVKDSPMKDMFPPHMQDIILHASLESEDFNLLGSDMPNEEAAVHGGPVSLMLVCDTREELLSKFNSLSEGGKVVHPVGNFFAGTMGNLTDKFEIRWNIFSRENS